MGRKVERWKDERKRGIYNRIEQRYLSLFFFQPSSSSSPQCPKTKDAEKKGKRYRGMKREEEGGSVFPSILNNGGMICAYPLITPLLYSSPPSSLLSLTPHNPSSSHLVGEG